MRLQGANVRIRPRFNPNHEPGGGPDGGQFSSGDGGGGESFISPNVGTLTFDQAKTQIGGSRQAALEEISKDINARLGIEGSSHSSAVGAWSDGAENSLIIRAPQASIAEIRVASAMAGYLADQKAVLVFEAKPGGSDFLAEMKLKTGDLDKVHKDLLDKGLSFHTLEPTRDGLTVHVYGSDQETLNKVGTTAKAYGTNAKVRTGTGEFIGTKKEDGTDRQQRDDARTEYTKIITSAISDAGQLSGRDVGGIWQQVRDRWSTSLSEIKNGNAFLEDHTSSLAKSSSGNSVSWKAYQSAASLKQDAAAAVLKFGGEKREYAAIIAKSENPEKNGTIVGLAVGTKSGVHLDNKILAAFEGSTHPTYDVHHNHPLPYTVSVGDLKWLSEHPRADSISAYDMQGGSSTASINKWEIKDLAIKLDSFESSFRNVVAPTLKAEVGFKDSLGPDTNAPTLLYQLAEAVALHEAGIIDFKYNLSPWQQSMVTKYKDTFDRVVRIGAAKARTIH